MVTLFNPVEYTLKEVKLEVTYECPLACIHCSSNGSPTASERMLLSTALQIGREIADLDVKEVAFSGGEPLIWEGLLELFGTFRNDRNKLTIYTSGNVDGFGLLIRELQKVGLFRVIFSIFGGDNRSHEYITRVKGSYNKTLTAVEYANSIGLLTELHFVPLKCNYRELPEVVRLAKRIGCTRVSVLRFVPQGRGAIEPSMALTRDEDIQLKKSIENGRKTVDIRTGSPYNYLLVNDEPTCKAGIDRLIVGPDYRIYPCDAFKQIKAEEITGTSDYSILGTYPLNECWEKSPFLNTVRETLNKPVSEPCVSCNFLSKCLSGCLAQKTIKHGRIVDKPDPSCLKGLG